MSKRGQFLATVKENTSLCREHFRLTLSLPAFPATEPGQFIQILCRSASSDLDEVLEVECHPQANLAELQSPFAFLRRPFSLAGRRDSATSVELDIIHRIVGVGTDWLSRLSLGDAVSLIGPLGNQFELPPPGGTGLLVAGGVGIPPMLYLAEKLRARAIAFCGATTRDLLPFQLIEEPKNDPAQPTMQVAELAQYQVPAVVTTDDGSFGFAGFVTQALEQYLQQKPTGLSTTVIYTCGPEIMMKRVAEIAQRYNVLCQVAVERAMACGMGTCQSCCIKVGNSQDWRYRLACTDGPIFAASTLLW